MSTTIDIRYGAENVQRRKDAFPRSRGGQSFRNEGFEG